MPNFELVQAFMVVFVTCENEEDPVKSDIKIFPLISLCVVRFRPLCQVWRLGPLDLTH